MSADLVFKLLIQVASLVLSIPEVHEVVSGFALGFSNFLYSLGLGTLLLFLLTLVAPQRILRSHLNYKWISNLSKGYII